MVEKAVQGVMAKQAAQGARVEACSPGDHGGTGGPGGHGKATSMTLASELGPVPTAGDI